MRNTEDILRHGCMLHLILMSFCRPNGNPAKASQIPSVPNILDHNESIKVFRSPIFVEP